MKVTIVNAYLRNNGDAALLSVLIRQLRSAWPAAELVVATLEDPADYPAFDGCVNVGSIRLYTAGTDVGRLQRIGRKLYVLGIELLWSRLPSAVRNKLLATLPPLVRGELQALETADLVVSTGGGYLNGTDSFGGNLNVRYVLLPIKLAAKLGKVVVMGPESYGPFGNRTQKRAVAGTLSRVHCILSRERNSRTILTTIGVPERLIVDAVDSGFAFDSEVVAPSHKRVTKPKVGITARLWFSDSMKQQNYMDTLTEFITAIATKHGASSLLIPQVVSDFEADDDDRVTEREIAAKILERGGKVTQLDKPMDPHELKRLYGGLDFTVGTRFHSVIFSLTSYVPAIAIEYEHKTSGIMRELGLEKWVININDVTADNLSTMFDALTKERAEYIRHLHKVLPPYIRQALTAGDVIKQAYEHARADADAA